MATPKLLVFVLGAPGAGKGTQSELVVKEFGWTHVSAGDLLRAEVQKGTEWGKQAEEIMREGNMVPSDMIIGLLKEALSSGEHTKVLVDGFPRVLEQLHEFEQQIRPCNTALFYNLAEDNALQRLMQRAKSSGRDDDNEETIHKRFVVFEEQSMPVVEALREQGRLTEIDAAPAAEEVYAATKQVIQQLEQELAAAEAAAAAAASPAAEEAGPAAGAEASAPTADAEAAGSSEAAAEPAVAAPGEKQGKCALPVAAAAAAATAAGTAAAAAAGGTSDAPAAQAAGDAPAEAAAAEAPVGSSAADAEASRPVQMDLSTILTPIVICGPSGVGKGTLIGKLMDQHPDRFGFSVSHTTRGPRPGEQHGVHYYFTDADAMGAQVSGGMFLEHAQVHGNMYGTSLAAVAAVSSEGKHCVLDIDVQGAQQVRASALGGRCLFIFVAPPSQQELERRLRSRGTETEDKVLQRLANATSEIAKAQEPGLFNHTLINGDLEQAYTQLQQLLAAHVPGLLADAEAAAPLAQEAEQAAAAAARTDSSSGHPAAVMAAASNSSHAAPPAAATAEPTVLANGTATAVGAGAAAAVAAVGAAHSNGGTSTLLDFGFGAAAGPAVAAKGMPVRQYMDVTVIPVLREGLKALNTARPDDPWQFLADYLVAHKPLAHA